MTLAQKTARAIETALAARASPKRRAFLEDGYVPSGLRIVGVSVPAMREIVRQFSRQLEGATARDVLEVAFELVRGGTVEGRQIGYELLARRSDALMLLTPRTIERLGRGNDNWATVDGFATYITGRAWRDGHVANRDVVRWAHSADRWWRRTALVSTVPLNLPSRGGTGDARRTLLVARQVVGDSDPMISKALSWALRSLVPHDPRAVRAFLARHGEQLPSIVRREVGHKLSTGLKRPRRPHPIKRR